MAILVAASYFLAEYPWALNSYVLLTEIDDLFVDGLSIEGHATDQIQEQVVRHVESVQRFVIRLVHTLAVRQTMNEKFEKKWQKSK